MFVSGAKYLFGFAGKHKCLRMIKSHQGLLLLCLMGFVVLSESNKTCISQPDEITKHTKA